MDTNIGSHGQHSYFAPQGAPPQTQADQATEVRTPITQPSPSGAQRHKDVLNKDQPTQNFETGQQVFANKADRPTLQAPGAQQTPAGETPTGTEGKGTPQADNGFKTPEMQKVAFAGAGKAEELAKTAEEVILATVPPGANRDSMLAYLAKIATAINKLKEFLNELQTMNAAHSKKADMGKLSETKEKLNEIMKKIGGDTDLFGTDDSEGVDTGALSGVKKAKLKGDTSDTGGDTEQSETLDKATTKGARPREGVGGPERTGVQQVPGLMGILTAAALSGAAATDVQKLHTLLGNFGDSPSYNTACNCFNQLVGGLGLNPLMSRVILQGLTEGLSTAKNNFWVIGAEGSPNTILETLLGGGRVGASDPFSNPLETARDLSSAFSTLLLLGYSRGLDSATPKNGDSSSVTELSDLDAILSGDTEETESASAPVTTKSGEVELSSSDKKALAAPVDPPVKTAEKETPDAVLDRPVSGAPLDQNGLLHVMSGILTGHHVDATRSTLLMNQVLNGAFGTSPSTIRELQSALYDQLTSSGVHESLADPLSQLPGQQATTAAIVGNMSMTAPPPTNPATVAAGNASIANTLSATGMDPTLAKQAAEYVMGQSGDLMTVLGAATGGMPALIQKYLEMGQTLPNATELAKGELLRAPGTIEAYKANMVNRLMYNYGVSPVVAEAIANQAIAAMGISAAATTAVKLMGMTSLEGTVTSALLAAPFERAAYDFLAIGTAMALTFQTVGYVLEEAFKIVNLAFSSVLEYPLATLGQFRNELHATFMNQGLDPQTALIMANTATLHLNSSATLTAANALIASGNIATTLFQTESLLASPFLAAQFKQAVVLAAIAENPLLANMSAVQSYGTLNAAMTLALANPLGTLGAFRDALTLQFGAQGFDPLTAQTLANQAVLYTAMDVANNTAALLLSGISAQVAVALTQPYALFEAQQVLAQGALVDSMILMGMDSTLATATAAAAYNNALTPVTSLGTSFMLQNLQEGLTAQFLAKGFTLATATLMASQTVSDMYVASLMTPSILTAPFTQAAFDAAVLGQGVGQFLEPRGIPQERGFLMAGAALNNVLGSSSATLGDARAMLQAQLENQGLPTALALATANQTIAMMLTGSTLPGITAGLGLPYNLAISSFLASPFTMAVVNQQVIGAVLANRMALMGVIAPNAVQQLAAAALTGALASELTIVSDFKAAMTVQFIAQGYNVLQASTLADTAVLATYGNTFITAAVLATTLNPAALDQTVVLGILSDTLLLGGLDYASALATAAVIATNSFSNLSLLGTIGGLQTVLTAQYSAQGYSPLVATFLANQTISMMVSAEMLAGWNPAIGVSLMSDVAAFLAAPLLTDTALISTSLATGLLLSGINPLEAVFSGKTLAAGAVSDDLKTNGDLEDTVESSLVKHNQGEEEAAKNSSQVMAGLYLDSQIAATGFLGAALMTNASTSMLLSANLAATLALGGVPMALATTMSQGVLARTLAMNLATVALLSDTLTTGLEGQLSAGGFPTALAAIAAHQAVQTLFLQAQLTAAVLSYPFIASALTAELLLNPLAATLIASGFDESSQRTLEGGLNNVLGNTIATLAEFHALMAVQFVVEFGPIIGTILANQAITIAAATYEDQGLIPPEVPTTDDAKATDEKASPDAAVKTTDTPTADAAEEAAANVSIETTPQLTQTEQNMLSTPFANAVNANMLITLGSFLRSPLAMATIDNAFTLGVLVELLAVKGFDHLRAAALLSGVVDNSLAGNTGNLQSAYGRLADGLILSQFSPALAAFMANQAIVTIFLATRLSEATLSSPFDGSTFNTDAQSATAEALSKHPLLSEYIKDEKGTSDVKTMLGTTFAQALASNPTTLGELQVVLYASFLTQVLGGAPLAQATAKLLTDLVVASLAEEAFMIGGTVSELKGELRSETLAPGEKALIRAAISKLEKLEKVFELVLATVLGVSGEESSTKNVADDLNNFKSSLNKIRNQVRDGEDPYEAIMELIKLVKKMISQLEDAMKGITAGGEKGGNDTVQGTSGDSSLLTMLMTAYQGVADEMKTVTTHMGHAKHASQSPEAYQGVDKMFQG